MGLRRRRAEDLSETFLGAGGFKARSLEAGTDYLSENDWQDLRKLVANRPVQPSLALVILGRAHQLLDEGNFKHATVEAVTALEVAISERIRANGKPLEKSLQSFWQLPLEAQISTLAVVLGLDLSDVTVAIEAIKLRNDIVHEGYSPREGAETHVKALFRTVSALLPNPHVKFPSDTWANMIGPEEKV